MGAGLYDIHCMCCKARQLAAAALVSASGWLAGFIVSLHIPYHSVPAKVAYVTLLVVLCRGLKNIFRFGKK